VSQPTELAKDFYDAFNRGDVARAASLFAKDATSDGPLDGVIEGRAAFRDHLEVLRRAIPDALISPRSYVAAGDTVAVQGSLSGTHSGVFAGPQGEVPPTGRSVNLRFADFITAEDGQILAHHAFFDVLELLTQLGLMDSE
jgi:steroid delta-isomerase-like uncharacterized protein